MRLFIEKQCASFSSCFPYNQPTSCSRTRHSSGVMHRWCFHTHPAGDNEGTKDEYEGEDAKRLMI